MNEFVTTALWDNATRDLDAETRRTAVVKAKVAVSGCWPFLSVATSSDEFDHRLALMLPSIEASAPVEVLAEVVAGLKTDWETLHAERTAETAQRRTAALTVEAAEGEPIPTPFVHVHSHKGRYQVDHVAGPAWLETIHKGYDADEALQKAKEFGLPHGMAIYQDGKKVAAGRAPVLASLGPDPIEVFDRRTGQWVRSSTLVRGVAGDEDLVSSIRHRTADIVNSEFFNVATGRWERDASLHVESGSLKDMTYHESYGPVSREQLRAYKRFNVSPTDHDEMEDHFGKSSPEVSPKITQHVIQNSQPHGDYSPRANWWRNAVFTPDPSDAERYSHYPPTPPSPTSGGSVVSPNTPGAAYPIAPPQVGPDGFPVDLSAGEGRSEEAYARQLTPGPWTVTPGTEWRDEHLPNAATGKPQGVVGSQHTAGEGVVPTPGPNPNYFSQGNQGIAGPPTFPEDPAGGIEPKTDNRMDDFYGEVPPQQSSGSEQGQTDGQGYSVQAMRALANQYIKQQGGKWVVTQKGTGKVLSHHDSQDDAEASFRAMMQSKHGGAGSPNFSQSAEERTAESHPAWLTGHYDARRGRSYAGEENQDTEEARAYRGGWDHAHQTGTARMGAFSDEHVSRYVDWARAGGHNPDEVGTLKRYEQEAGVGRAHTNHIADQLYIGGGDHDWRKNASTDGRIVGHCDHCQRPVRYHTDENGTDELRHLHNGDNKCSSGSTRAKTARYHDHAPQDAPHYDVGRLDAMHGLPPQYPSSEGANAAYRDGYHEGEHAHEGVHPGYMLAARQQFFDPNDPRVASLDQAVPPAEDAGPDAATDPEQSNRAGVSATAGNMLERPTPENPTGRGADEFRARTWDSLVKQRPMQSAEDRNINTPTQSEAPIPTRNINTPTPGLGTREEDDQDEVGENQNAMSRET